MNLALALVLGAVACAPAGPMPAESLASNLPPPPAWGRMPSGRMRWRNDWSARSVAKERELDRRRAANRAARVARRRNRGAR